MNKVSLIKGIAKLYFGTAVGFSSFHLITSAEKLGGHGIEAYMTPVLVDGIAILGLAMRSEDHSAKTRQLGLITQVAAGALSLAGNLYAAQNLFGILFGLLTVILFLWTEFLASNIESVQVDIDAANATARATAQAAEDAKRADRNAKARARRAASKAPKTKTGRSRTLQVV